MLTARVTLLRAAAARSALPTSVTAVRMLATPRGAITIRDQDDEVSRVEERQEKLNKENKSLVYGATGRFLPAPVLPENLQEMTTLDPADLGHRLQQTGVQRTVVIRQEKKSMRQAPLNPESVWKIFFYEDGMAAEKWTNSLMGWTSNADPYQCAPPLTFTNAADAMYFAKKRGWNYVVSAPYKRYARNDDAQYQDNFLPQALALRVQKEKTACDFWYRKSSMTSHYARPLKYHGDGTVQQYGPNPDEKIAPHVPGVYKMR